MKSKKTISNLWKNVINVTSNHSSEILTGLSIVGLISTAIAIYKAAPIAEQILEERRRDLKSMDKNDKKAKKLLLSETVKEVGSVMLPSVILGCATTACIIGSHTTSSRKIAALTAAYNFSESAAKDLNKKMEETFGKKKVRELKENIVKDKINEDRFLEEKTLEISPMEEGDVLCMDLYSGRLFRSNAQKIGEAINRLSHDIQTEMYVSLNDFYELLNSPNLPPIPLGNDLGWNIDDTDRGMIPISYTAVLTESKRPCLCVEYDIGLRADFRNLK